MINFEERFFSYLKGKMNSKEKKEFEEELLLLKNLNKDFAEYKKLHIIIDETKNIRLNKDYSESIITEFRKRKESQIISKSSSKISYAFASIIVIIIGYFLISLFNKEKPMEIASLLTDFSEAELDSLSYNIDYSSDIENINYNILNSVDSMYNENLSASLQESIDEKSFDDIIRINNIADVDEYLSENDVELIYAHLIDKEIL